MDSIGISGSQIGGNNVGAGPEKGPEGELKSLADFMDLQGNISAEGIMDIMGNSLEEAVDFLETIKQKANAGQAGNKGEHLNLLAQQWIDKLENKAKEDGKNINAIG